MTEEFEEHRRVRTEIPGPLASYGLDLITDLAPLVQHDVWSSRKDNRNRRSPIWHPPQMYAFIELRALIVTSDSHGFFRQLSLTPQFLAQFEALVIELSEL